MYQPDLNKLRELEGRGLMRSATHPTLDLTIWNYTSLCQFEGFWDENTQNCRGLVTDSHGNVIARPWPKFRNIEEHQYVVPDEPFEVTEKMDGSLGILFRYQDQLVFASRGSFGSDQAIEFQKIWIENNYDPGYIWIGNTYLFEIIYPENRIVVNYGDSRCIIQLSVLSTDTGKEVKQVNAPPWPIVKTYHFNSLDEILALQHTSRTDEGFVLRFIPSDFRVKVKMSEYCRLHNIVTNASSTSVWEAMMRGDGFEELLEKVPDEFYTYIKKTQKELQELFDAKKRTIRNYARPFHTMVQLNIPRKEIALKVQELVPKEFQGLVFADIDGKDYSLAIWKSIKPVFEKPFWGTKEG